MIKCSNERILREAYKILQIMEEDGLSVAETKKTAKLVMKMLKENEEQLHNEAKHKVLFEPVVSSPQKMFIPKDSIRGGHLVLGTGLDVAD